MTDAEWNAVVDREFAHAALKFRQLAQAQRIMRFRCHAIKLRAKQRRD